MIDPEQHVNAPLPGLLLRQDTYYIGNIKRFGKIYMQTVIDVHYYPAFAELYLSKAHIIAADVLSDSDFPFYEEQGVSVKHILTDYGREYCGLELQHPLETFLVLNQVEHRSIKVRLLETNGFAERCYRTVQEEFIGFAFRKTSYESVDQLQPDLDR